MNWIKRSEKEPDDNTDIFIWKDSPSEWYTPGWYVGKYKDGGLYSYGNPSCKPLKKFSHWAPLPEPPKENE